MLFSEEFNHFPNEDRRQRDYLEARNGIAGMHAWEVVEQLRDGYRGLCDGNAGRLTFAEPLSKTPHRAQIDELAREIQAFFQTIREYQDPVLYPELAVSTVRLSNWRCWEQQIGEGKRPQNVAAAFGELINPSGKWLGFATRSVGVENGAQNPYSMYELQQCAVQPDRTTGLLCYDAPVAYRFYKIEGERRFTFNPLYPRSAYQQEMHLINSRGKDLLFDSVIASNILTRCLELVVNKAGDLSPIEDIYCRPIHEEHIRTMLPMPDLLHRLRTAQNGEVSVAGHLVTLLTEAQRHLVKVLLLPRGNVAYDLLTMPSDNDPGPTFPLPARFAREKQQEAYLRVCAAECVEGKLPRKPGYSGSMPAATAEREQAFFRAVKRNFEERVAAAAEPPHSVHVAFWDDGDRIIETKDGRYYCCMADIQDESGHWQYIMGQGLYSYPHGRVSVRVLVKEGDRPEEAVLEGIYDEEAYEHELAELDRPDAIPSRTPLGEHAVSEAGKREPSLFIGHLNISVERNHREPMLRVQGPGASCRVAVPRTDTGSVTVRVVEVEKTPTLARG